MKTLQVNKGGRPTIYSEEIVRKLESVYQLGVSDEIACQYAGIVKDTLYRWRETIEGLSDRLDTAKHFARIAAGSVVIDAIKNKDVTTAKWWLEKKYPQEFGTPAVQLNQQFNVGGEMTLEFVGGNDENKTDTLATDSSERPPQV